MAQELKVMSKRFEVKIERLEEKMKEAGKARLEAIIQISRELSGKIGAIPAEVSRLKSKIGELEKILEASSNQLKGALNQLGKKLRQSRKSTLASLEVVVVGPNEYRVSRKNFRAHSFQVSMMATKIELAPHFKRGKSKGLKVLKESKLLARFGFKKDDIIRRVNGLAMTAPEKTREVYSLVSTAKEIKIELTRKKKPLTFIIHVDD